MLWEQHLQVFGFLWPCVWGRFLGHSCFIEDTWSRWVNLCDSASSRDWHFQFS